MAVSVWDVRFTVNMELNTGPDRYLDIIPHLQRKKAYQMLTVSLSDSVDG